ncbi:ATP-binding protein [Caulobacter soli]|uniref:ATP-binding protein n=1 Tax=Caulobacter soli TaxID=2708539 RepID=UPI0013EA2609|nr:ATP-binding protein [Caulobacter soli]
MSRPNPLTPALAGLPFDAAGLDRLRRPVWVFDDVRKRKVYANPAAVALWGADSLDALLARDFSDQSPAVQARMEALAHKVAGGDAVTERWTFYPLGHPISVQTTISALTLSDGGEALLFEAVPDDRSPDEQRAAEALRHTPVLVGLFDAEGRRLFANPSRLTAFPDQTAFGHGFVDPSEASGIWKAALEQGFWVGSCQVTIDGQTLWHGLDARRTLDPVTGDVSVLVNQVDMTDEIEARRELAVAHARAEAAVRSQEEFLANMSHELRTPLTSVIGFAGLLRDAALSPEQRRYLGRIEDASQALMSTLNDVLDLSKLDAGGVELDRRPFALEAVLDQALGIIEAQAGPKGLTLAKQVEPDMPRVVVGDPERLRQILLNLLGNAVKFTIEGSVTLAAACLEDGRIELSVTDTGVGLAEDMIDHVFERFTQADASVTRQFGGTGLGLSISRRLAEAMGGEVGASSQLGQGSRFWCVLPLPIADEAEIAPQPAAVLEAPAAGVRVLLADDNEANRELVGAILRSVGHQVDLAVNGVEAVTAAARGEHDLVLMDVQMPLQDGVSATRAIRRLHGPAAGVPIIALSANVLAHQIETYRACGMNDHIAKPIAPVELLSKVAWWGAAGV